MDTWWINDDDDRVPGLLWAMGIAGTVPFWCAALLLWSDIGPVTGQRITAIAIAYGALVLAFLGGTRWGTALIATDDSTLYRDRLLAILPGLGGLAAMFLPPVIAFAVLISLYLCQALWDLTSAHDGRLPAWSATLRIASTTITVPALLAMLARVVTAA